MNLFSRIGWMLVRPKKVFPQVKQEKLGRACLYLFIVLLISSLPLLIAGSLIFQRFFAPIFQELSLPLMIVVFVLSLLLLSNLAIVIGILLGSIICHISLKVFRTKIKYGESLKLLIYAGTPFLLTYWLVPLSIGTFIWSVILTVRGYQEMCAVPKKKTLGVILFFILLSGIFSLLMHLLTG